MDIIKVEYVKISLNIENDLKSKEEISYGGDSSWEQEDYALGCRSQ